MPFFIFLHFFIGIIGCPFRHNRLSWRQNLLSWRQNRLQQNNAARSLIVDTVPPLSIHGSIVIVK
jgi:hypothetical protein